jgi:hypothetical protein
VFWSKLCAWDCNLWRDFIMLDFMWFSSTEEIGYSLHIRCHLLLACRVSLLAELGARVGGRRMWGAFDLGSLYLHMLIEERSIWKRSKCWSAVILVWIATGVADCREHLMALTIVLNADCNWTSNVLGFGCKRRCLSSYIYSLRYFRSVAGLQWFMSTTLD